MNRSIACLLSYVAAWWMKLIAAVVVLLGVSAMLFLWSRPLWEPAWPHPHLESSTAIQGGRPASRLDAILGLKAGPDCFRQPPEKIRAMLRSLPQLRFCQIDLPYDGRESPQTEALQEAIDVFFDALAELPDVEAVELTGRTSVAVLERLRGNPQIRRLSTTQLYANDAAGAAEWFAMLVDTVIAMPAVEVWGLPRDMQQRVASLDAERLAKLQQHPTLRTLLVPPDELTLGGSVWAWCEQNLPSMHRAPSHIDRGRLAAAWGLLGATIVVSGLLILSVAGMLVVSAAAVVPSYAQAHRRVVAVLLVLITLVAAVALVRVHVAPLPAVLWAAFAALVPAAMLEWDRRRAMPGMLVLPISLAWCVGLLVPVASIDRGWWWVWFDQFVATNLPTPTTWAVLAAVLVLAGIAWRAMGLYMVSLAERGRTSAVTTSRLGVWQQLDRGGRLQGTAAGSLWGPAAVMAGPALRKDRLSSPDTAAGRRRLLAEGELAIPRGQMILQGSIVVVLAPVMMSIAVPAFREKPQLLAVVLGAIALAALWFRPGMVWHERALRLPCEIGGLLPRPQYVAAMRGLLARQMRIPVLTLAVVSGVLLVWNTGELWKLVPLVGLVVGLAVIVVSVVELTLTLRSTVLKFVAFFAIGYGGMIAGAMSYAGLLDLGGSGAVDGWARSVPLVVVGTMAVGLRLWMNIRIPSFEFGRLA